MRPAIIAALLSAAWLATGCGRVEFEPNTRDAGQRLDAGSPQDAGPRDADPTDAGSPDAGPPDAGELPPFETPREITELASGTNADDPTLRGDLLELYFNRGSSLYRTSRASSSDPWGMPATLPALESDQGDSSPELTSDGLTVYFASNRAGSYDIFVATRSSTSSMWGAPAPVPELNTTDNLETNPTPTPDNLRLVFSRGSSSTARDLFEASRASTADPFGAPEPLTELNTSSNEGGPMLALGGTMIVFFSNRNGNDDLFFATRPAPGMPFDPPEPIEGVNTSASEGDPWISEDGRTLFFTRGGALFQAVR